MAAVLGSNYRDAILDELDKGKHGDFAAGGVLTSKPPLIDVQGVGRLALPLSPAQAEALAAVATPAPYGKGTATLLDQTVRSSLQVEPDQLTIANEEEWSGKVARAFRHAAEGLGLPPADVKAELYKLLLYRPGDFFLPHKDTEKEQGMVATLVITLPSVYEGGELTVRHQGQQRSFFRGGSATAASKCSFAALYADCEHEVQRVAGGHRLALVYNLLHVGTGPPPAARDAAAAREPLRQAVAAWRADTRGPSKLCIMLEHQYTEAGIVSGLRALKGADRTAGRALGALAAEGLVDVHLAILEKHETGSAAEEYDPYDDRYGYGGWGKRRRCWYGDEDEQEEDDEEEEEEERRGGHTMEEIHEVTRSLDHWVTLDGQKRGFGSMRVDEDGEVLPGGFFDDLEPDEEDYEGFAGNHGPTLDRIYRRAALVVWPRSRRFQILAENNINGAVAQLAADVAAGSPDAPEFAAGILAHLEKGGSSNAYDYSYAMLGCSHSYRMGAGSDTLAQLAKCLTGLARREAVAAAGAAAGAAGRAAASTAAAPAAASQPSAAQLADRFLRSVLPQRLDVVQHALPVGLLCQQVGWAQLQPALAALVQNSMAHTKTMRQAALLLHSMTKGTTWVRLSQQPQQAQQEQQQEAAADAPQDATAAARSFAAACEALAPCCALLVEAACSKFEAAAQPQQAQQAHSAPGHISQLVATPSADDLANMLHSLALLGQPAQLQHAQRLLPHAVQHMSAATVPALLRLQRRFGWDAIQPAAVQLVAQCERDAAILPHTLSLLRQLAEAAVGGCSGSSNGGNPAKQATQQQEQRQQRQQRQQQQAQHQGQRHRGAAAGKENAGPAAAALPQAPAKPPEQLAREQELQQQLAGLLAAVLDVVLRQGDLPAGQANAARQPDFLVDAFAAVHALLPAVGLLPCRPATIAGLPLTGLADRLALLSSRAAQREERYPPIACLHPACKALHTLLGEQAEADCPALLALTRHTAARLKAMAAPLLSAQPNWTINRRLGCTCGDCRIAQSFLAHPTKQIERIRLAEQRRKHVHRQLDATVHGLVTHMTERSGRPYALVLTKTKRHWEERQAEGKRIAGLARELKALLPVAAPWEGAAAAAAALAGVPPAAGAVGQQQQQQQQAVRSEQDVIDLT